MKILTETKKKLNNPIRKIKKKTSSRKWSKFEDLCDLFIEMILTTPSRCTKFELEKHLYEFSFKYNLFLSGTKNANPVSRGKAIYWIRDCIPKDQVIDLITVMYECGKKYYHMENHNYGYTESLMKNLYKRYGIRSIYLQSTEISEYYYDISILYDYDELNEVWGKKDI